MFTSHAEEYDDEWNEEEKNISNKNLKESKSFLMKILNSYSFKIYVWSQADSSCAISRQLISRFTQSITIIDVLLRVVRLLCEIDMTVTMKKQNKTLTNLKLAALHNRRHGEKPPRINVCNLNRNFPNNYLAPLLLSSIAK